MLFLLAACAPRLTSPVDEPCADQDNIWYHNPESPQDLEAQGFEVGQRPPNFCQLDQNGDTVSLYQFYGAPVVVDVSTGWCAPCRHLAGDIGLTQWDYQDFGLVYMSVMPQDFEYGPPTPEFADDWEKNFMVRSDDEDQDGEIDPPYDQLPLDDIAPVIADVDLWSYGVTEQQFPELLLLDSELRIVSVLPPSDTAIRDDLDAYFGVNRD